MKQRAARERVHLLQRDLLLARPQFVDRMQQETVRARREMLQRRWRIAAGAPAAAWPAPRAWRHPAPRCRRRRTTRYGCAARSAAAIRPDKRWHRSDSVPRPVRIRAPQRGQIELGIVDGFARVGRRGPIQARWSARGAPFLRTRATRAAVHAPRARFPARRTTARAAAIPPHPCADTKTPGACGPPRRRCADGAVRRPRDRPAPASPRSALGAVLIQQDGIFMRAAGKQAFAESRQEYDVEYAPAHFVDTAHEDAAIAAQPAARVAGSAGDRSARRKLRRAPPAPLRPWPAIRPAPTAPIPGWRKAAAASAREMLDPIAPVGLPRQSGQPIDQRQRESLQILETVDFAFQVLAAAFFFLAEIRETHAELRFQAAQAARPTVAAADHRRIHQQLLPSRGRLQRAADYRGIFAFRRFGLGRGLGLRRGGRGASYNRASISSSGGRGAALAGRTRSSGRRLTQREIFGEARSGAALARAR